MKKLLAIICMFALISTALCVFAACGGVREVDVDRLLTKCNAHYEIPVKTDTPLSIDIDTDSYSVYVEEIDFSSYVTLDYVQDPNSEVAYTDGVTVTQTSRAGAAASKYDYIIVGIPERAMARGQITLDISTESGSVQIDDIVAGQLNVRTQSGTVLVDGSNAVNAQITSSSGDVSVDAEGNVITISTLAGKVYFDLTFRDISVTTTGGSVRGSVEHPEYWYAVSAHSDTGRCNLRDRASNGEYKLNVSTSAGNINVRFDED